VHDPMFPDLKIRELSGTSGSVDPVNPCLGSLVTVKQAANAISQKR